jgi:hypothetical protein
VRAITLIAPTLFALAIPGCSMLSGNSPLPGVVGSKAVQAFQRDGYSCQVQQVLKNIVFTDCARTALKPRRAAVTLEVGIFTNQDDDSVVHLAGRVAASDGDVDDTDAFFLQRQSTVAVPPSDKPQVDAWISSAYPKVTRAAPAETTIGALDYQISASATSRTLRISPARSRFMFDAAR